MELEEEELQIFELAFLLRMPVYKLMSEMPYEELQGWFAYFRVRPPGWQEDYRASLIIQSHGAKVKPDQLFPSLKAISENKPADNNLKNSAFFLAMLSSTEGRLPFMDE